MRSRVAPVPKDSFGPLKTESPLSAKSLETIRLFGRKEASNALLIPGEADYYAKVPIAQADLAVSPFKTHPKLQTRKGDSTSKKVQSIPMKKARGTENRKQRSIVPTACELSESEDDLPVTVSPLKTKRSAVQRLPFSNSPGKRNVVVATQGNVRKYDPMKQQRNHDAERHDKLRSEYTAHRMASCIDV